MIKKILIANRGEIAVRAIRACREMGIETVAVYTEADKESLHVSYADKAVCIGPGPVQTGYLYTYNILAAATASCVDAIYPGSGFFAENAIFAQLCEENNIKFIGAKGNILSLLTSKLESKRIATEVGVPVVRATKNPVKSVEEALAFANEFSYPVIIKAQDGGGGKGIRIVRSDEEMPEAYTLCKEEALNFFKNDAVFVEKYVENARHVEVQVLADSFGNVHHLYDRDCTMQRRNQKLIEEAVSIFVPDDLKAKLYEDAIRIIKSIHYEGAATVEFLVDKDFNYYFMEVNPRVQVEHPITEMVTGIDIVKEQIRIASGEPLSFTSTPEKLNVHAIECRINAEDMSNNFLGATGKVTKCVFPRGNHVRVESHLQEGFNITPYYDSMVAKIIVTGNTRDEAISRMIFALDEICIEGVKTNISLQKALLSTDNFKTGNFTTTFVEKYLKDLQ